MISARYWLSMTLMCAIIMPASTMVLLYPPWDPRLLAGMALGGVMLGLALWGGYKLQRLDAMEAK